MGENVRSAGRGDDVPGPGPTDRSCLKYNVWLLLRRMLHLPSSLRRRQISVSSTSYASVLSATQPKCRRSVWHSLGMDTSPIVQMFPLSLAESPVHCVKQFFVTILSTHRQASRLYASWSYLIPRQAEPSTTGRCSALPNSLHRSSAPRMKRERGPDWTPAKCGASYLYRSRRFMVKTFTSAGSAVVGLLALWRYCSYAPQFALILERRCILRTGETMSLADSRPSQRSLEVK